MRSTRILVVVLLSVGLAFAQTQQSKALSPFEQELVSNKNQYVKALADKNIAYVNQAIADDFKGIGTNGDFYDKEELVGGAHEGAPREQRVYDVQVVRLNDESAIVTYNMVVPGSRVRYRHMSDTWAKDGGK